MTPEQRERRNARKREWYRNMTPEQRERVNAYEREYYRNMTPEQRERRNACRREHYRNRTPEQRERDNARQRERYHNRTPEQRERDKERKREPGPAPAYGRWWKASRARERRQAATKASTAAGIPTSRLTADIRNLLGAPMPSDNKTKQLIKRYREAEALGDQADLSKAEIGHEALALHGGDRAACQVYLVNVISIHGATAAALLRMADALDVIPSPTVWRNCGWEGIRRLLRLPPEDRDALVLKLRRRRRRLTHGDLSGFDGGVLRDWEKRYKNTRPRGYSAPGAEAQEAYAALAKILGELPPDYRRLKLRRIPRRVRVAVEEILAGMAAA